MAKMYRAYLHESIPLQPILNIHGWSFLYPAIINNNSLTYSTLLHSEIPITFTIREGHNRIIIDYDCLLSEMHLTLLKNVISRMLSVDFPMSTLINLCKKNKNASYLRLAHQGWGRLLRSPSAWEDAIKTLFTTNASWGYTKLMCRNLCSSIGKMTKSGFYTFPNCRSIIHKGEGYLSKHANIGYRSRYLILLSKYACTRNGKWLFSENSYFNDDINSELNNLVGFGDYARTHLKVLLGDYSNLPIDREVSEYLGKRIKGERHKYFNSRRYNKWEDFQFIAYKYDRIIKNRNWLGK
jgi:hypothetical protein